MSDEADPLSKATRPVDVAMKTEGLPQVNTAQTKYAETRTRSQGVLELIASMFRAGKCEGSAFSQGVHVVDDFPSRVLTLKHGH